ncbi:MAG: endolytic transglycosylase MltG [Arcobacteraceae bacterium]|nr:endolytic transglycosylase MltG [Arcobacteraceae bacterium]
MEFILIVIISISFYLNLSVESKQVIYIPKGSTSAIVTYLDKKGYDLNLIDTIIINAFGYPQNGWIDLKSTKMLKGNFLYKLTTSKAALKNVVLIPGETYYFFLDDVASKLKLSSKKLFKYYDEYKYKKDGNILAQTYSLPIGMDEEELILYLFKYTNRQYKEYSNKIFGQYNQKNWFRYIAIASIIQKEAATTAEMSLVSSVIYNRLKYNMKLQMDGTLNYGKFSHTKVTPLRIKEDDSIYNTYKYKGIPNSPICAVEFNSIKAAIFPKKTQYLYFMKANDGKNHIFSTSYKRHKRAIRKVVRAKKTDKINRLNQNNKIKEPIKQIINKSKSESTTKTDNIKSIWDNVK